MKSFISEHSAEYIIVNKICNHYHSLGRNIVPLYLIRTREGNNLGQLAFTDKISAFIVYPRRPKVYLDIDSLIYFKINQELTEVAQFFKENGLPVYFSGPLIKSLDQYSMSNNIAIMETFSEWEDDIFLAYNEQGNLIEEHCNVRNVTIKEIINVCDEVSLSWMDLIDLIKIGNQISYGIHSHFSYLCQYKPIIFIGPK